MPAYSGDDKHFDIYAVMSRNVESIMQSFNQQDMVDVKELSKTLCKSYACITDSFLHDGDSWDQLQHAYFNDLEQLTIYLQRRLSGQACDPIIEEPKGDKRFIDHLWRDLPLFDYIKQYYLLSCRYVSHNVKQANKVADHKLDFYWRNFMDAFSPSNFALTNPEVWRKILQTNGENIREGMQRFLHDYHANQAFSLTGHVNSQGFELGKTLATTKGDVVYENYLFQLIRYHPKRKTTHEIPLLIIPPWINKYYIFDLRPENSYVKWALEQGYQVYIVSWINPEADYADVSFRDYVIDGVKKAVDVVAKSSEHNLVNTLGYCSGGCLLAAAAAYFSDGKQHNPINAMTLLATPCDFSKMGDLKNFVSKEQVDQLEVHLAHSGVLSGEAMVKTFSWMRANDMIWSNFVNSYLLNKDKHVLDFLFWNCDSTNTPARMHIEYLRNLFLDNAFMHHNRLMIDGVPIDLSKVEMPVYVMAAKNDHIVPYEASFAFCKLVKNARFVLSAAGHVAGVINPPLKKKYCYWTNDNRHDQDHDWQTWFSGAKESKGSWWSDWNQWLKGYSGKRKTVAAQEDVNAIEAAPGRYALARSSKIA